MQSTVDDQFAAIADWSLVDCFVVMTTVVMIYCALIAARYFWLTRRQPVRRDAPTGGSWTQRRPYRD